MKESEQRTRYLLGDLPESELTTLEEEYFADPQAFDQMVKAESELVDDYARGRLSPQLRERFEQYYLAYPKRRERMEFAQALVTRVDRIEADHAAADSRDELVPLWRRLLPGLFGESQAFAFSMTLALLLLTLGVGWLLFQTKRLREELAQTQTARVTQEQRERELQQQLVEERTRVKSLNDELQSAHSEIKGSEAAPATTPTSPAIVTLLLTARGLRGADTGPAPKLIIPTGTEQVRIQLDLKEGGYPNYSIVLQAIGGSAILSRQGLKPKTSRSGASFVLMIPARKFANGDYMLTLSGVSQAGEVDALSKSLFRVEKR